MTDHSDYEKYMHLTLSASSTPTDTQVDAWCTAIDTIIADHWADVVAAVKTFCTVMTVHLTMMPLYKRGQHNAFAAGSGGEQSGGFQYQIDKLFPPFIRALLDAANGEGDYCNWDPYT